MARWCANCGRQVAEEEKFCRQCGMPQELRGEEATTWRLPPETPGGGPTPSPVKPPNTGQSGGTTGPAYVPPLRSYNPPPPPVTYSPPAPQPTGRPDVDLGSWLSGGWQVYKENWALMSVATLLGSFLSLCTLGILAGPLLLGLFVMAFKTMRGEQPVMSDLFNWQGRFGHAFLAFLIFFVAHMALAGLGSARSAFPLLPYAASPILAIMLSLTMPNLIEQRSDVVNAVNDSVRTVFTPDWFKWWLVGLVMAAITAGGFFACGIGGLITLPWMICTAAVAYRDTFGFDDPNRTQQ